MIRSDHNIECTINLHKRLFGVKFKDRAPRAIFEIKKFAKSLLNSNEIRIDSKLNNHIWKYGPRHVPLRIRIRISKQKCLTKKNIDNSFIFVSFVNHNNFKKMQTKII
nr:60S ribosomal protein L31 [Cryptomonas curvata]